MLSYRVKHLFFPESLFSEGLSAQSLSSQMTNRSYLGTQNKAGHIPTVINKMNRMNTQQAGTGTTYAPRHLSWVRVSAGVSAGASATFPNKTCKRAIRGQTQLTFGAASSKGTIKSTTSSSKGIIASISAIWIISISSSTFCIECAFIESNGTVHRVHAKLTYLFGFNRTWIESNVIL